MNRHQCADSFPTLGFQCATRVRLTILLDALLNGRWPNVVGLWINVGKKRSSPDTRNASGAGKKRVRRRDNRVTATNSKRHQNGQQSISPRRNTNGMRRITIRAHRLLERLYVWAKDETAACQYLINRLANGIAQDTILFAKIKQRHAHGEIAWQFRRSIQDVVVLSPCIDRRARPR